jgi:anti-sigma B factor antagonist
MNEIANSEPATTDSNAICRVSERWEGRVAILSTSGDVDMLGAPHLQEAIENALAQDPTGVIVDFTDVDFLASAGMGVLVAAYDAKPASVEFCVVADGPATSRPLQLVGIADIIKLYPTSDEALAALTS